MIHQKPAVAQPILLPLAGTLPPVTQLGFLLAPPTPMMVVVVSSTSTITSSILGIALRIHLVVRSNREVYQKLKI